MKRKPKIEFSCISFFENGKCPKERWLSMKCPFNIIPNGNCECMYSGNFKKMLTKS